MEGLGYVRFAAHAYDVGASVTGCIGLDVPERLIGYHTTEPTIPRPYLGPGAPPLTEAEHAFVALRERWQQEEGGYAHLQSTRPQTLAYGLSDSPVGLAAWIVEKWRAWTDPDGDVEAHFTKDELLTNVTIYWVTQTANSANRYYYERQHHTQGVGPRDRIPVPAGVTLTAMQPIERPPREYAARLYVDIRRWAELPRGGHFVALEEPGLLAAAIRAFFRALR
jgi:pimeloyl-ACP methyl ester carboxylesterase